MERATAVMAVLIANMFRLTSFVAAKDGVEKSSRAASACGDHSAYVTPLQGVEGIY